MGFLKRLFGGSAEALQQARTMEPHPTRAPLSDDEQAVERYRYMLRTAPPETIEQAHAEAFAKLTPEQRQLALQELSATVPASERVGAGSDPQSLARLATRAEMRQPGTLERAFGGNRGGMGMGMGGIIAGSLLASVAGTFIGSAIANQFFAEDTGFHDGAGDGTAGGTETFAAEDTDMGDFGGFEG